MMRGFCRVKELARTPAATTVWGILVSSAAATGITIVFRNHQLRDVVPLLFLVIIGVIAWFLGTWASIAGLIAGLIAGSLIFSEFMYAPVGSLSIAEDQARLNIVMMVLFGLAVAYFYGDRTTS